MIFFYWGYLKSKILNGDLLNLDQLKTKIQNASRNITPLQLSNVLNNFHDRFGHCLAVNGEIFENLL